MKFLALCLGLLLGGCSQPRCEVPAKTQAPFDVESATSKTVALVKDTDGKAHPYCAGVWVGRKSILTAWHCVQDKPPVDLAYSTASDVGNTIHVRDAVLVRSDPAHDLALLRAAPGTLPRHATALVEPNAIKVGQDVHTLGHPLGLWFSYSKGNVSSIRYLQLEDATGSWVQTTLPVNAGNSGGALFDDNGLMRGICHAKFEGQSLNLFLSASHIYEFLKASADE